MQKRVFGCAAFALAAAVSTVSIAAPFTPGNLVVTRGVGGSGTYDPVTGSMTTPTALAGSGMAATVVLDEYTTSGVFVQSVVMPNVQASSGNRALTFSGTQNNDGHITLSGNGQYLIITGYNQTAGVAGTNNVASGVVDANGVLTPNVERVVGVIGLDGSINTSTALMDAASSQPFRSAYSTNGVDIWVNGTSGGNLGTAPNQVVTAGIRYTTVGSVTSTQLTAGTTNMRVLNAFNGQLYISSNSTNAAQRGVNAVGTGFPTSGGPALPLTQQPGFNDATAPTPSLLTADDYWFKDATTLYIADQRNNGNGGVSKWLFVDTTGDSSPDAWVFQYVVNLGAQAGPTTGANVGGHSLAGTVDPLTGQAILFATTFDGAGANRTQLVRLVDDGTQAGMAGSLTVLATSPDQLGNFATAFRGVEYIPIPEPTMLSLLSLGGFALLGRRRQA